MELLDQILLAAQIGETTDWEFKSAKGGFPGSFWETYSAMANSEGGRVVLGVREKDGKAMLDGLTAEAVAGYQKILWDGLNDKTRVNINLMDGRHVRTVPIHDAFLLVVDIPRATRLQRPVHLGPHPYTGTYRRLHEGDYHCTDVEVRRMLADADTIPRDHRILKGFTLDDLDAPTLAQYRQLLRVVRPDSAWHTFPDRELLTRVGAWRRDHGTGEEGLTLAGLLMFGKDLPIRDPEAAPAYSVDYREKLHPDIRWTDRIFSDGTWEANLFQFYHRVIPKLYAGLPTPFQLVDGQRRDYTPAHEGLREAFVNALIHADYSVGGGVVVERFPDRFVFQNPGTLLISQEQYRQGGISECRNPALQQMFLLIGGGEKAGSGVDKIHQGWRFNHWRAPRLSLSQQPDRVVLELPMVSLIPDSALMALKDRFGEALEALSLPERLALATAHLEGAVSNLRLQEILEDHKAEITRLLQGLCERGFLRRSGRGRWTTYVISNPENSQGDLLNSADLAGDSYHKGGDSYHKEGDSYHKAEVHDDSGPAIQDWALLEKIAEPVSQGKRVTSQEVMETVLLALCQGRYLTAEQLGKLVRRDPVNLRSRYLKPLLEEGKLVLRFPHQLNRPDQAYTAAPTP